MILCKHCGGEAKIMLPWPMGWIKIQPIEPSCQECKKELWERASVYWGVDWEDYRKKLEEQITDISEEQIRLAEIHGKEDKSRKTGRKDKKTLPNEDRNESPEKRKRLRPTQRKRVNREGTGK